jgi:hypothetical protein
MAINPDAVLRGRIGAHQFHATNDLGETTRNARAAFLAGSSASASASSG